MPWLGSHGGRSKLAKMHGNFHVGKVGYHSLEQTGDAGRFGSKVVLYEWVEKIAVGHAPAAQLKTDISLFYSRPWRKECK